APRPDTWNRGVCAASPRLRFDRGPGVAGGTRLRTGGRAPPDPSGGRPSPLRAVVGGGFHRHGPERGPGPSLPVAVPAGALRLAHALDRAGDGPAPDGRFGRLRHREGGRPPPVA